MNQLISQARDIIKNSNHLIAFTGAGISVESGIPPFRGQNGIWNKYDPSVLDISHYVDNPESILEIRKMFFEIIDKAKPNNAHYALAQLEKKGILKSIITQNIDNLHFNAGNTNVIEFHGNTRDVVCMQCGYRQAVAAINLNVSLLKCPKCGGLMKPDFVFFGEAIPAEAYRKSFVEVQKADVVLVIGTTGLIVPASLIPSQAKEHGAKIIEINIEPSEYTNSITDIFLQGKACDILEQLI